MENRPTSLRPFPCPLCPTEFDSRSHLRRHLSNVHNKIIGVLDCCGVHFPDKIALKNHTQSCHLNYKCGVCDKRYNTQNSLNRHQLSHSDDYNKFHCNVCEYATCQKANLKRHVETQHGSGLDEEWHVATKRTLKYKCTRCRRGFQWTSSLRQHMERSHGVKARKLKCSTCHYSTDWTSHLKRHLKAHESKGESRPINASVESSRRSTEIIYTDASDSTEDEDDIGTFSVDHQLRSLRILLKRTDNDDSPVDEERCHSREIKGDREVSKEKAPSDISDSGCEESCYPLTQLTTNNLENVDEVENNATIPTSSVEHTSPQRLSAYQSLPLPPLNPIHGEARKLRSQISLVTSIPAVLSILERLLELSATITKQIRSSDGEFSSQTIECFEYLWNTSKMAVCRWEDMEGSMNRNTNLRAVKYAYEILPVFFSLEINAHLEMVECVNELVINTVKNCQHH